MYAFLLNRNKKKITVVVFWVITLILISFFSINFFIYKSYPLKYEKQINELCRVYGLEKTLVYAVIREESGFNEQACSGAGAIGLMQLTPATAQYVAKMKGQTEYDIYLPQTNLDFGCYYLKYLLVKFKNTDTAICAYNAGEGNVLLWLKNKDYSLDGKTLRKIPFKETSEYLKKVNLAQKKYKKIYGL